MKNKEHVLLLIMGESASGKDTLANKICETMWLKQLVSYTTRPRRTNEGETHVFVSEDDYQKMLYDGQVAAHTVINNYHYWCTIDQLYESSAYIIDPIGVQTLRLLNLPNLRLVTVYINVPEAVRKERAINRGDDINVYRSRCLSEKQQFREMKKDMNVDYVVSNLEFPKAFSILKWIATAEGVHAEDNTE